MSGYAADGRDLYAAIWRKEAGAPAWQARHGLDPAQYQAFFEAMTSQGFKAVVVSGYGAGGATRYAAIFSKVPNAPAWQARHGLSAAEYQSTFDGLVAKGYRLEFVNACSVGGRDQFAAIWTR